MHTAAVSPEGKMADAQYSLKPNFVLQYSSEFLTLSRVVMLLFIWLTVGLVTYNRRVDERRRKH